MLTDGVHANQRMQLAREEKHEVRDFKAAACFFTGDGHAG